jgi:hypothetical protein
MRAPCVSGMPHCRRRMTRSEDGAATSPGATGLDLCGLRSGPLEGLTLRAVAARHARMRRPPELQCESGRPAPGSSTPSLRTPASAAHPSQTSRGRDRWDGFGGVWARCGGDGWGERGEATGIFGWERNLGVENRRRHEDLRTVMRTPALQRGTREPVRRPRRIGSVYDLHALPTRDLSLDPPTSLASECRGRVVLDRRAVRVRYLLACPALPCCAPVGPFGGWVRRSQLAADCNRWCCATM